MNPNRTETAESMTGFGRAQLSDQAVEITVEIKSVNSKQLDLKFRTPLEYYALEQDLTTTARSAIRRGRVDVVVTRKVTSSEAAKVSVNTDLFKTYFKTLADTLKSVSDGQEIDYTKLGIFAFKHAEVLDSSSVDQINQHEKGLLEDCFELALAELLAGRREEGRQTVDNLQQSAEQLSGLVTEIERNSRAVIADHYKKLKEKLISLFAELDFSSERISQEAAIRAERADITEEVARLGAHFSSLKAELSDCARGKKLEFLVIEIRRELNTINSKAQDLKIQQFCLSAKLEVEKIKEQAMNLQ